MIAFILVLTVFSSAPGHMGRPVLTQSFAFRTAAECVQKAREAKALIAPMQEVRYVNATCLGVVRKEGT